MAEVNRQFLLAARPQGMVKETDFEYRETPVPEPAEGQVLVRTRYISLDPSMRGQMENRADYVAPLEIGDVMRAGAVGEVVRSRHPDIATGTLVTGSFGMQDYALSDGREPPLRTFPDDVDPTAALGILGGTGMTAYFGLLDLGRPRFGDTVVVSGAAGATGSVAGQIAKIHGCRVVGIAGSAEKCRWLNDELGFDAAIDYRKDDVPAALDAHCPNGIDVYFDNVGGEILEAALDNLRKGSRIVLCGSISEYTRAEPFGPTNYTRLRKFDADMRGFFVYNHAAGFDEAEERIAGWIRVGRLRALVDISDGFDSMPGALIGLYTGTNRGKRVVRVTAGEDTIY